MKTYLVPRIPREDLPAMLRIALVGGVVAGAYGILHDQITYSISPEYFTKLKFNLQYLRRLSANNSLLLRMDGQWTDDIMVAMEQYAIGGAQNVRAYPVAEALVDTGASATLEWIINAPGFADKPIGSRTWGEVFQLSFYGDYAFGKTNNPLASQEPTVDYSGYGLGLQFNVPGKFFARFDVASPFRSRFENQARDQQYFFRMSYTF